MTGRCARADGRSGLAFRNPTAIGQPYPLVRFAAGPRRTDRQNYPANERLTALAGAPFAEPATFSLEGCGDLASPTHRGAKTCCQRAIVRRCTFTVLSKTSMWALSIGAVSLYLLALASAPVVGKLATLAEIALRLRTQDLQIR
jgi:hypothetical protein